MDLMQIRRGLLLTQKTSDELYPIGTNVIEKYIGLSASGNALLESGHGISTINGDYIERDSGSSPIYIPIKPEYRFRKDAGGRLYVLAYYDENYNYISYVAYNTLTVVDLPAPPANARFMRYQTHVLYSNWDMKITRIA